MCLCKASLGGEKFIREERRKNKVREPCNYLAPAETSLAPSIVPLAPAKSLLAPAESSLPPANDPLELF